MCTGWCPMHSLVLILEQHIFHCIFPLFIQVTCEQFILRGNQMGLERSFCEKAEQTRQNLHEQVKMTGTIR